MSHWMCHGLAVLALVGGTALGCSSDKEKGASSQKGPAAQSTDARPSARPRAAARARPMMAKKTALRPRPRAAVYAPRPSLVLLKSLGLAHITRIGALTCDRMMATMLCLLDHTPADVHSRSAKDLRRIWSGWQKRLSANTQSARDKLERDCLSTMPILLRVWKDMPNGQVCVPKD